MLNLDKLKTMKPGIFLCGEIIDSPDGINIANSGKQLRWVAIRGEIHEWTLYCHFAPNSWEDVKKYGDKITTEWNIKKLVPCDDAAFDWYKF